MKVMTDDQKNKTKIILTYNIKEHNVNSCVSFTVFARVQSSHVLCDIVNQQTVFTASVNADLILISNSNDSPV